MSVLVNDFSSKSERVWICSTSMSLWVALQLAGRAADGNKPDRGSWKAAVRSYPYDSPDCRCKACRYHRLIRRVNYYEQPF